ncbi:hypothetical protein AVEN_126190-1 [Araneus ventricosus]|uniref:Uncharacterized protein n=1 Tax=Araneus ventricosus TaxID=182803 RepID=A0A4Y2LC05_ARAVE|nr:hypothetical protein AVEN_126190-1 [Araneus ventricosus]
MAKDIFFISVGCLHVGYTAVKIYEAFHGDLPSFTSVAGYVRKFFQAEETEMAQFVEPIAIIKANDDICLDDSDIIVAKLNPESFQSNEGNFFESLNVKNSGNDVLNGLIPERSPPSLSRRAQAIKTSMTMKSKRWLQEQTRKDSDYLVFRSATNYRYAKRFGLNAKLAPAQKRRY